MIQTAAFFRATAPATVSNAKGMASARRSPDATGFADVLQDSQTGRQSDSDVNASNGAGKKTSGKGSPSLVTSSQDQRGVGKAKDSTAKATTDAAGQELAKDDTESVIGGDEQAGSLAQSGQTKEGTATEGGVSQKAAAAPTRTAGKAKTDGWGAPGDPAFTAVATELQQKAAAPSTRAERKNATAGAGGKTDNVKSEGGDASSTEGQGAASSADAANCALAGVTIVTAGVSDPASALTKESAGLTAVAPATPATSATPATPATPAASLTQQVASDTNRKVVVAETVGTAPNGLLSKAEEHSVAQAATPAPNEKVSQFKQVPPEGGVNGQEVSKATFLARDNQPASQKAAQTASATFVATAATGAEPVAQQEATVEDTPPSITTDGTQKQATAVSAAKVDAATKTEKTEVPAPSEKVEAAATAALTDAKAAAAEDKDSTVTQAAAPADSSTKPAEAMEGRNAEGAQRAHVGQKHQVEQEKGSAQEGSTEISGPKSASAGQTGKLAPSQGSAEQKNSGDAGKNGEAQQNVQGKATAQSLNPAMGLQAQAPAEVTQTESQTAHVKNQLHESILSQVKDGVVTHDAKGNGQLTIRLNPGELGELKIQVRMDNNRVTVEVQADNKMVKDLLMSNLDTLKEALSGKNFSMEGFDVSTGGSGFNSNSSLSEQKANSQQQSSPRFARAGGYDEPVQTKVKYVTEKANSLLDVRF